MMINLPVYRRIGIQIAWNELDSNLFTFPDVSPHK